MPFHELIPAIPHHLLENAKESDMDDLKTELTLLKKVNREPHPNVIRLVGSCSIEGIVTVAKTNANFTKLC